MLIAGTSHICCFTLPTLERAFKVRPLNQPHGFRVQPAGSAIVCAGAQTRFALLDGATGETLATCDGEPIHVDAKFALSACGRFVIYAYRDRLRVREFATGELGWERQFVDGWVRDIRPIADGDEWLLSVCKREKGANSRTLSRLEIWTWPFGPEPRRILQGPDDAIVSRGGRIATLGGLKLHVYAEDGDTPTAEQPAHHLDRLLGWIDDEHFACANDRGVDIREAQNGAIVRKIALPGHGRSGCVFSPDGADVAIGYYEQGLAYVRGAFADGRSEVRVENPWPPKPRRERRSPGIDHSYRLPAPRSVQSIRATSMAELRERLSGFQRQTWTPIVMAEDGAVTSSKFGGTPYLADGETWPRCVRCGEWLQLALQLNAADLPAEPGELFAGILQAFFCTAQSCVATEPFAPTTLVRLTHADAAPSRPTLPFDAFLGRRIVGWQSHVDFPHYEEIEQLGVHLADGPEYDGELLLPVLEDKLLGWPAWVQNVDYVKCPLCGGAMRVLMQFMSEHNVPFMFGDGGTAWVSQCPTHTDTLAFHCEV